MRLSFRVPEVAVVIASVVGMILRMICDRQKLAWWRCSNFGRYAYAWYRLQRRRAAAMPCLDFVGDNVLGRGLHSGYSAHASLCASPGSRQQAVLVRVHLKRLLSPSMSQVRQPTSPHW